MVFCTNCGTRAVDGGKFCMECGTGASAGAANPKCSECKGRGCAFCFADATVVKPEPPKYQQSKPEQQEQQAPPGTFKVQLPFNVQPNQMMQVQVPPGHPQAGQVSTFRVPPGCKAGGFVFAPLPTGAAAQHGGQFNAPYGNGGYGNGGYSNGGYGGYNQPGGYPAQGGYYQHNNGPSAGGTALAAGAGALGGFLLADALFDF